MKITSILGLLALASSAVAIACRTSGDCPAGSCVGGVCGTAGILVNPGGSTVTQCSICSTYPSQSLQRGESLVDNSAAAQYSARYQLINNAGQIMILQSDENLVVYNPGYKSVVWASNTGLGSTTKPAGSHGTLLMQTDGNLVLYRSFDSGAKPVSRWNTGTRSSGVNCLYFDDFGTINVLDYRCGVVWRSK
ncbi:hypothetical protein HDV00_011560 [Rhizophlyctis rosea]|nr:hypothetical protein HDV00_011560 [Rhizophlyctis rosea]